ncbi:MAG: helix-turn-helix domain-containing protein [Chitinispirillaceae bacterium]
MAKISKSQLEKLQKKHQTDDAIGKLFGITRQAVHQLRQKYDIPAVQDKNESRNLDIIRLYNEGVTGTKIARRFNLSISQTYRVINEVKNAKATKQGGPKKKSAAKKAVIRKKKP